MINKKELEKNHPYAKQAEKMTAREYSEEIKNILKDYFVAEFEIWGDKILIEFLNGQRFNVTVEEVV